MHTIEGPTYHFVPMTAAAADGTIIQAYAYVAAESFVLLKNGAPLQVAFNGEVGPDTATFEQAVQYMLDIGGEAIGVHTAADLVRANAGGSVNLAEKIRRQEAVRARLVTAGLSAKFTYPGSGVYIGRADFGTPQSGGHTPLLFHLAEERLANIRPTEAQIADMTEAAAVTKARNQLDVMAGTRGIRMRATTEIGRNIGADILRAGEWGQDGTRIVNGVTWKKVQTGPDSYRIEKMGDTA